MLFDLVALLYSNGPVACKSGTSPPPSRSTERRKPVTAMSVPLSPPLCMPSLTAKMRRYKYHSYKYGSRSPHDLPPIRPIEVDCPRPFSASFPSLEKVQG